MNIEEAPMRRTLLIAVAALTVACSGESTSPGTTDLTLFDAGAFGTALTSTGGYDADIYHDRLVNALPDELKLTDAQKTQIRALIEAFKQSTRADREALAAILREAVRAIEAGKSRTEVGAILAKGADIRRRLAAAEAKLKSDIDAVLTPEQRAWIEAHSPKACRADRFPPLTDAQKAQIRALEVAFQVANQADLALVKSVLEEAHAAARAGKSREEVAQILQKATAAVQRLEAARRVLRDQILAVLTPEQKASGCLPLG
jgi:Spy/CpxP family protein refolding chaperone